MIKVESIQLLNMDNNAENRPVTSFPLPVDERTLLFLLLRHSLNEVIIHVSDNCARSVISLMRRWWCPRWWDTEKNHPCVMFPSLQSRKTSIIGHRMNRNCSSPYSRPEPDVSGFPVQCERGFTDKNVLLYLKQKFIERTCVLCSCY